MLTYRIHEDATVSIYNKDTQELIATCHGENADLWADVLSSAYNEKKQRVLDNITNLMINPRWEVKEHP